MSVPSQRFERQARLAEVGEAGQRRIEAAKLSVGASGSADVEAMYLERAGVAHVRRSREPDQSFQHGDAFRYDVCRIYGAGAWRALRQLSDVLDDRHGVPDE